MYHIFQFFRFKPKYHIKNRTEHILFLIKTENRTNRNFQKK